MPRLINQRGGIKHQFIELTDGGNRWVVAKNRQGDRQNG